jgi:hypothetical protein
VGLSETILAAMIGAIATVTTALFQLFNSLRQKSKTDARPKRGMTMRSILAVLALMTASAAGGFLYSEFIKQRAGEDMRAMREELKELKELTARVAAEKTQALAASAAPVANDETTLLPASMQSAADSAESVVYVPACRRADASAGCTEGDAQRIALCGSIPSYARVNQIDLFVQPDAVQNAWDQHRAQFEQDLGGARFTGKSFEYAQSGERKAVCVNFTHWSPDHPHIARILVQYGYGDPPAIEPRLPIAEEEQLSPTQSPAVIAADTLSPIPQAAVFTEGPQMVGPGR